MLKLSVIIPTLNRDRLLKQTLESIENQTMSQKDFEIIVVDNGSTDNTHRVCEEYNKKNGNLIYIYDDRPGLHIGRNRGFKESKTSILVYADDDIVANPLWLDAISRGFEDAETVLIGGSNLPLYESSPPRWMNSLWRYDFENRCRHIDTHSIIDIRGEARPIDPGKIFGCNFAVRKRIIDEANGFHPDGVPDSFLKYRGDGECYITRYIIKHGLKAMFYPNASVSHVITKGRMEIDYIKKVAFRNGISDAYTELREMNDLDGVHPYRRGIYKEILVIRNKKNHNEIEKIKGDYYLEGKLFLVKKYISEKELREWIHRREYFDAEIDR